MRRVRISAGLFVGLVLLNLPVFAQDTAATAAAVAAQQGLDERFKQLAADIDSLRAADEALQDKLSVLTQDVQQLRSEQANLASNSADADALKSLAAKIEEVDKKRLQDKQSISDEIKQSAIRLERLITDSAAPAPKTSSKATPTGDESAVVNGYTYTVKEGDTLGAIIKAYNADFKSKGLKSISINLAKEANPSIIEWNHLKVGRQIIIPRPPG